MKVLFAVIFSLNKKPPAITRPKVADGINYEVLNCFGSHGRVIYKYLGHSVIKSIKYLTFVGSNVILSL